MFEFRLKFHRRFQKVQFTALFRRQAIVWTNPGHFSDAYMRHLASMSWTTTCDREQRRSWPSTVTRQRHRPRWKENPYNSQICRHEHIVTATTFHNDRDGYYLVKSLHMFCLFCTNTLCGYNFPAVSHETFGRTSKCMLNSLTPSDAYMRR